MAATPNTPQDYLNFLMETLQKISENPNPQVIYPFLAQNLDKLDENLLQVLDNWSKNTLSLVKAEEAVSIAGVIVNFSSLIQQFSDGNIAINLEIAIAGYEIALNTFTFDIFTQNWAITKYSLAIAYLNRIRGDKAENLEKAIAHCEEVLTKITFDAFPEEWATTKNNLGTAYNHRIKGDKPDNLETAISHYKEAIENYKEAPKISVYEDFTKELANTNINLANAYSERIRGDKDKNLEQAIIYYKEALEIYETKFPQEKAKICYNLALAYSDKSGVDQADYFKEAIDRLL